MKLSTKGEGWKDIVKELKQARLVEQCTAIGTEGISIMLKCIREKAVIE
jgi:hypothetical protein